jgi:serine protease
MRTPWLTLAVMCASLLAPLSLNTRAQSAPAANARVIVKYRADSPLLRAQALSATTAQADRVQALGRRVGMALSAGAGVAERTHVVFAAGMSSEQLAQRLAAESDIEYAVPDQRRHLLAAPNDPLYAASALISPASGQWYLRAPAGDVKSSIDVETAWNLTTGSPNVVVAVLDTGVRFDHRDLKTVAAGGNLLPGYDMIMDAAIANDGNGRDADPSDPGDWVSQADRTANPTDFGGCAVSDSSWHGTQTAGLIGALTGNGIGMASVGRNVRVLPVRVLGKCGGFDSDIIAGIRWAAGLSTGDATPVPANPNPARVINMSLGGDGACSAAYRDAVAAVNAVGVVVVAAAGNTEGHAVGSPANCAGVIAVAGVRHVGTKVGFSDIGPEISLSAPGGNCVNLVGTCLYPILTSKNSGTTTPVADANGGSVYSTSSDPSFGTSFSAPLVAGTAALMLSVNPALTATQVRTMLQSSARPFPTTGGAAGTPQCVAPQPIGQAQVDQDECYCTTATCGAGMLDAGAAVTAASVGVVLQANIGVSPSAPQATQTVTLSAAATTVPAGRSIANRLWTLTSGGGIVGTFAGGGTTATTDTVSATPSAAGTFSVSLTVTDSAGAQSTVSTSVTVAAAPVPPPPAASGGDSGGGGGALGAGWLLLLAAAVGALRSIDGRRRGA